MFQQLEDVWDTGDVTPFDWHDRTDWLELYDEFKNRTGATKTVKVRWVHEGSIHIRSRPFLLVPDQSVALCPVGTENFWEKLIVIEPNNAERYHIPVPRLDGKSNPEKGFFSWSTSKIQNVGEWGVDGFDGYRYALFCFDWQTGQLTQWEEKSAMWAMHNGVFRMPPDAV